MATKSYEQIEQKQHYSILITAYEHEITLHQGESYIEIEWDNINDLIDKLTEMQSKRLPQS